VHSHSLVLVNKCVYCMRACCAACQQGADASKARARAERDKLVTKQKPADWQVTCHCITIHININIHHKHMCFDIVLTCTVTATVQCQCRRVTFRPASCVVIVCSCMTFCSTVHILLACAYCTGLLLSADYILHSIHLYI
jgi:hypothetical protein